MPQINSFKSMSNTVSAVIEGTLHYGILQNLVFSSGQTVKYMLLEIPADVSCQYITQGLTLAPYDDTFKVRMIEGITTLTTGTPVIIVDMNRNFQTQPILCNFTSAPVGSYGSEGTILADFNSSSIRQIDFLNASKILKQDVERILKPSTKYLFEFSRTTEATTLTIEFRWIWIEV